MLCLDWEVLVQTTNTPLEIWSASAYDLIKKCMIFASIPALEFGHVTETNDQIGFTKSGHLDRNTG